MATVENAVTTVVGSMHFKTHIQLSQFRIFVLSDFTCLTLYTMITLAFKCCSNSLSANIIPA